MPVPGFGPGQGKGENQDGGKAGAKHFGHGDHYGAGLCDSRFVYGVKTTLANESRYFLSNDRPIA